MNELNRYLSNLLYLSTKTFKVVPFTHGATALSGAYRGAVYSPTQNRIYFIPFAQGANATWHYVNCDTGAIVGYAHSAGVLSSSAYRGGVYSPLQNRIYMVPLGVTNNANWHYINCDTGAVVAYANLMGLSGVAGYSGGCYSPTQNRI
jgi:hypothetical protein